MDANKTSTNITDLYRLTLLISHRYVGILISLYSFSCNILNIDLWDSYYISDKYRINK